MCIAHTTHSHKKERRDRMVIEYLLLLISHVFTLRTCGWPCARKSKFQVTPFFGAPESSPFFTRVHTPISLEQSVKIGSGLLLLLLLLRSACFSRPRRSQRNGGGTGRMCHFLAQLMRKKKRRRRRKSIALLELWLLKGAEDDDPTTLACHRI